MHSATVRNSHLSNEPPTNRALGTFSPTESTAGPQRLEVAGVHQTALRQPIEIDVQGGEHGPYGRDRNSAHQHHDDRLLNAREVADKLGVSERFIRDHTTRRSPKIPAVKLGKLIRYRRADVDIFMAELQTLSPSRRAQFGV
jgi:excisionase family DNA binding protein